MTISAATTTTNPLLSTSTTTSNPLSSASSTTSNPLLVNNYPTTSESSAQESAGQQILTQLGGSSINVLGIESSLISAAREPQQKIINTAVQTLYTAQTSMTTLQQGMTSLQTAADALDNVNSLNQLSFTDTDGAVSATAGGSGTAVQGSHQVTVYQLAAAQESLSQSFSSASSAVSSNQFTMTITPNGSTSPTTVTIPANQTLTQIAATINNQNIGITAQVVDTGSGTNPYSLMLSGGTGSQSSFTVNGGALNFTDSSQESTSYSTQTAVPQADAYLVNINSSQASSNPTSVTVNANASLSDIVTAINTQSNTTGVTAQLVKTDQGAFAIDLSGPSGANSSYSISTTAIAANTSYSFATASSIPSTSAVNLTISPSSGSGVVGGTISIPANSTLTQIAAAINAQTSTTGVQAAVEMNADGNSYLAMTDTSGNSGTFSVSSDNSDFSINSGANAPNLGFAGKNVQNAQDASFSVDNIQYSRPSNTVSDVLAGVSLTLNAVNSTMNSGASTLGVSYDTTAIATALNNFVTAFNNYQGFVASATGQSSTSSTVAGSLQQYPEVNSDLSRISNMLISTSSSASGNINTWADIGVSIQVSGQLSFDQSTFTTAFNASPSDVITALSNNAQSSPDQYSVGANGLAGDISVAVQSMMATTGTIGNVNSQITSGMTAEQSQQDALNLYIQNLQSQYDAQFSSLQSILSQFSSTSSQLQQTYDPTKSSS